MDKKLMRFSDYKNFHKKDIEFAAKKIKNNPFLQDQIKNGNITPFLVSFTDSLYPGVFALYYSIIINKSESSIGKPIKNKIIRELKSNQFIYHYDKNSDIGCYFYSNLHILF